MTQVRSVKRYFLAGKKGYRVSTGKKGYIMSCVLCVVSCVLCLVSCVLCHLSCVLCLVSCVVRTGRVGCLALCQSLLMSAHHCTYRTICLC